MYADTAAPSAPSSSSGLSYGVPSLACRSGPTGNVRPPVLLIHGISLASTCWVLNSPAESLAFILADQGETLGAAGDGGSSEAQSGEGAMGEGEVRNVNDTKQWPLEIGHRAFNPGNNVATHWHAIRMEHH